VSKTTTTFNLGWALADAGKKVLIVDGDPQCNLTGTVLGFDGVEDFTAFYKKNPNSNISAALDPVFSGAGTPLKPAGVTKTPNKNLHLLAGNITLAENETQIAVALSTSAAIPALQNTPGAICALLRMTAAAEKIDIVLVDMSPSVGALNQCLLMGADYFIIPTSPDYYCNQAITSLARVIPKWNGSVSTFRSGALLYPFPLAPPKFCGISPSYFRVTKIARTKTRPKGRTAGSLNKRTTQRLIEVGKQVAEVKKLGQKKATEVLNELVQTSRGMVGLYQRKVVTADGSAIRDDVKQEDVDNFWEALSLAIVAAKSLAPYQDPQISRIDISTTMTPGMPIPGAGEAGGAPKVIEGKR
jgi:cellulose biosynthesis protein BcsQ